MGSIAVTVELAFLASVLIGTAFAWLATVAGRRLGLVDRPSAIKPHARPTPYTGGAAILATILLIAPLGNAPIPMLLGAASCWLVGAIDDFRGLAPITKLATQAPGLLIGSFAIELAPIERALAVSAGLVLLNAFNVVDGLDGLAAGVAAFPIALLTVAGAGGVMSPIAFGAVLGFLLFNMPPAKLFLGDQGSLLLGYLLWMIPLSWLGADASARFGAIWALLWLFPIVNMGFVLYVRARAGRPLLRGDRSHLYDVLNRRFGLRSTLAMCWGISVLGVLGVAATS